MAVVTGSTRQRPLGLTLSAALLMVLFALLGYWQWGRVFRPVDGFVAEPTTVALDSLIPAGSPVPAADEARQVAATGTYTGQQQVISGRRVDGASAEWVVSTLRLGDGTRLLVVRGWLAPGQQSLAAVPSGSVTVTGRIEPGKPAGSSLSAIRLRSGYLIRTAQVPPDPLSLQPVPSSPPTERSPASFHLQNAIYVVQWFLLVGFVAIAWWRLRRRPEAELTDEPASVPAVLD